MSRLAPVDRPRTWFDRVAFWMSKRQFGVVLGPVRVQYTRVPRLGLLAQGIVHTAERLSIPKDLRLLITANASRLNGCAFCYDLKLAQAFQAGLGRDRFDALDRFESFPLFSEAERAALAYCSEALDGCTVSDAAFARLRAHFDEREIVEITWVNAAEAYFNLQTGPLGIPSDGLAVRA